MKKKRANKGFWTRRNRDCPTESLFTFLTAEFTNILLLQPLRCKDLLNSILVLHHIELNIFKFETIDQSKHVVWLIL